MKTLDNFREYIKIELAQTILSLEGIKLNKIEIKSILEYSSNAELNQKINEIDSIVIENMLNTLDYYKSLPLNTIEINTDLYINTNAMLAKNQALSVGGFRNGNSAIDCIEEAILPPDISKIEEILSQLNSLNKENCKDVIAQSFPKLSKMQPFWDGNKRSTLFICNLAMLKKDLGIFSIPHNRYDEFTRHLRNYYVNDDKQIIEFIKTDLINCDIKQNIKNKTKDRVKPTNVII